MIHDDVDVDDGGGADDDDDDDDDDVFVSAAPDPVPPPAPTEANNADIIAGVAIAACSVGAVVIVVFDLASLKASASLLMQNIRTISAP